MTEVSTSMDGSHLNGNHSNLAIEMTGDDDQSIFQPTELETEFLSAVLDNNTEKVSAVIHENGSKNVNCLDSNGQTALQIAVKSSYTEMVVLLLENGADVGNALLDAINDDSLACVELLVPYDKLQENEERKSGVRHRHLSTGDVEPHSSFVTPLMLAAQRGNYDIIKFLMTQGYELENLHRTNCGCAECESHGKLGIYLRHLNTYRALVNPVYISLSYLHKNRNPKDKKSKDPIYRALILKKELVELADKEYEFRDEYEELAKQIESFAQAMLDQCRSLKELEAIMDMPGLRGMKGVEVRGGKGKSKKLSVLNFAIKCSNSKFIAHRYSQVMLNTVLYQGLQGWKVDNMLLNGCLAVLYVIIMPLMMVLYSVTPRTFLSRLVEAPLVKFMSHAGSMIWFVVLLILAAFQDKLGTAQLQLNILDILIGLWVIGILVEELKQFWRQGKERYLAQWYHMVTLVVVLLFVVAGLLWLAGYAMLVKSLESWAVPLKAIFQGASLKPHNMILLSNSFYAVALVLTFFQASHSFQVSYTLGPLHLSMMNMVGDVAKFFILFSLNYLAFCFGIRKLYSQYVQTRDALAKDNNGTFVHDHSFGSIDGSFRHMFWALFGHTPPSTFKTDANFEITAVTGELMFALYCVAAILVALNLLIAMLTNTYQKVEEDRDITFKVVRTRIWMQYINAGSVYPPPFNLLPVKSIIAWFKKRFNCCNMKRKAIKREKKSNERQQTIRLLIQRYIREMKIWQHTPNPTHDGEIDG